MKTTRLEIRLRYVEPPVMRLIDVPTSTTLPELHELLQAAMGWTDSHLHQFLAGDLRYGVPPDDPWDDAERDEAGVRLLDLPDSFTYLYDFGDGWEHDVRVVGPGAERPGCPAGEGACPPEDCGGAPGYEQLLQVLGDPRHEEYEELRAWAGDLGPFDLARCDAQVRGTVGEVPGSVRLVLDLLSSGVKLTPAGRLPRTVVRQVQAQRPTWAWSGQPASVEEDLMPLAVLHHLLRQVGLLRLSGGVLRPTKAAADDLETVRRLRRAFPAPTFGAMLATSVIASLVAQGPHRVEALASQLLPDFRGWSAGDDPITMPDLRLELYRAGALLEALDQITQERGVWSAGAAARTLLPRAIALAAIWAQPQQTS